MRMLQGQTLQACSLDGSTEAELMRDCHADVCRQPCMTAGPCTAALRDSKVHVVDSSAMHPDPHRRSRGDIGAIAPKSPRLAEHKKTE